MLLFRFASYFHLLRIPLGQGRNAEHSWLLSHKILDSLSLASGMLLACLLLVFLLPFAAADFQNLAVSGVTLSFASGWKSTTSQTSGNFSFTDTLGLALTITLPRGYCFVDHQAQCWMPATASTTSINYVGLKTTGGSIYGVCLDCTTTSKLQEFSGHDATADAVPVSYIYHFDGRPLLNSSLDNHFFYQCESRSGAHFADHKYWW